MILALLIATAVPLIVLYIIYTLDLYGSDTLFRWACLCFIWGGISVGLAYFANTAGFNALVDRGFSPREAEQAVIRYATPIIEELLKAALLIHLVRRPKFVYFVDGAIYGFAVGMGFAIFENYFYLYNFPGGEIGTAVSRVLSTNLMHATASAIVGITLGFSRFQRFSGSTLLHFGGLLVAIIFHAGYNNLVTRVEGGLWLLVFAAGAGFGGALIIALVMKRGLTEQRDWINETLGAADRVTKGEAAVVHRLADAHAILAPLAEIFGQQKADQIENFLVLQARLGILRKTVQKLNDEKMQQSVEKQMDEIRVKMDDARREVGAYTMMYLRSIFPDDASPVWGRLESVMQERAAAPRPANSGSLWASLGKKTSKADEPASKPAEEQTGEL